MNTISNPKFSKILKDDKSNARQNIPNNTITWQNQQLTMHKLKKPLQPSFDSREIPESNKTPTFSHNQTEPHKTQKSTKTKLKTRTFSLSEHLDCR